jgi:hypothetical protein
VIVRGKCERKIPLNDIELFIFSGDSSLPHPHAPPSFRMTVTKEEAKEIFNTALEGQPPPANRHLEAVALRGKRERKMPLTDTELFIFSGDSSLPHPHAPPPFRMTVNKAKGPGILHCALSFRNNVICARYSQGVVQNDGNERQRRF